MSKKSVVSEAQEIQLAIELIQLGARLQLLESEVSLSRERLLKLYKELKGVSPPKGMLPFSTDWFLTWQPNIHSSLYINIYKFLVEHAGATGVHAVMKAYKLYLEQMPPEAGRRAAAVADPRLDPGALLPGRHADAGACSKCKGKFVVNSLDLNNDYQCGLCHMPSRAGKTRKAKDAAALAGN
jgi:flagellar transcriptional activator FlhC